MRRMLDLDISGKQRRGRPNLRWKNVCKKDMAEAGLKEDNITNRAAWRNKIISHTGDPRRLDKPGTKKKKNTSPVKSKETKSFHERIELDVLWIILDSLLILLYWSLGE